MKTVIWYIMNLTYLILMVKTETLSQIIENNNYDFFKFDIF